MIMSKERKINRLIGIIKGELRDIEMAYLIKETIIGEESDNDKEIKSILIWRYEGDEVVECKMITKKEEIERYLKNDSNLNCL